MAAVISNNSLTLAMLVLEHIVGLKVARLVILLKVNIRVIYSVCCELIVDILIPLNILSIIDSVCIVPILIHIYY